MCFPQGNYLNFKTSASGGFSFVFPEGEGIAEGGAAEEEVMPPGGQCAKEAPRRNPVGFATRQSARICVVGVL